MTSHDVVSYLRRLFGIKKIGHAGTLDPAAAGVLPIFLGAATRFIEYTADADKSYRVEINFGYATDTGDTTGKEISRHVGPLPDMASVIKVLPSFVGNIEQIPPMYSAIKLNGKKLYELAREGLTVDRKPRQITIHGINVIKTLPKGLLFDVTCSKGTYIRTLCSDIGDRIGCPAVMSFLVRTRVGPFTLQDSMTVEEVAANKDGAVFNIDTALGHLPTQSLTARQVHMLTNGRAVIIDDPHLKTSLVRLYDVDNQFIGVGRLIAEGDKQISPVKILPKV
jgi:tRNA pseudouridine55 synthase